MRPVCSGGAVSGPGERSLGGLLFAAGEFGESVGGFAAADFGPAGGAHGCGIGQKNPSLIPVIGYL